MGVSRVSWLGLIGVGALTALLGASFASDLVRSAKAADHEPILGRFYNSYYYVVTEADFARHRIDNVIQDLEGRVVANVSTAFKRTVSVEGSGKLRDGRMINYAAKVDGEVRFFVTPNPWGNGAGACALEPFRTIAVDPSRIPLGALVRIDETVGIALADGSIHDGLWRAEDIGEVIRGDRIDLFVGERAHGIVLDRHQIYYLRALTVRLVAPPPEDSCVNQK